MVDHSLELQIKTPELGTKLEPLPKEFIKIFPLERSLGRLISVLSEIVTTVEVPGSGASNETSEELISLKTQIIENPESGFILTSGELKEA